MTNRTTIAFIAICLAGVGSSVTPGRAVAKPPASTQSAPIPLIDLFGKPQARTMDTLYAYADIVRLKEMLDPARPLLEQARVHLAIANHLLAVPTAIPATRWVIGIQKAEDLRHLSELATDARQQINRARSLLKSDVNTGDADDHKQRRSELASAADTLDAFAAVFAAANLHPGDDQRQETFAEAALSLAVARESDNPQVASCALLWQSLAWEFAGRHERAMKSLPNSFVKPEHWPFDFLSRLLRCRIIDDAGQHVVCMALTVRMDTLCRKWSAGQSPDMIDARRRLIALVQLRAGQAWLEQLRTSKGLTAATDSLEDMLANVRQSLFASQQPDDVYHLDLAVPVIVEPPRSPAETPQTAPATSSAPATAPN